MHRSNSAPGGQQHNQPFNLAPVAKTDGVAQITATFCQRGGLKSGIIPKLRNQIRRRVKRCTIMNIGELGRGIISRIKKGKGHFCPLTGKTGATITGNGKRRGDKWDSPVLSYWRRDATRGRAGDMNKTPPRNPAAGGFLIAMGAILGAFGGVLFGESTRGFFAGLVLGAVLAVIVWWRDRG